MTPEFHPLIPERWDDLEKLFGEHGATGGCWCMWWRQSRAEFNRLHGEANKQAFKNLVNSGTVPGLLAYVDDKPVGWCAVEPRESYSSLERSRTLARVDNRPVWSIPCFYVSRQFRGKGVMRCLINAAVDWAGKHGAKVVEAYPMDPVGRLPASWIYTGVVRIFSEAGFGEVLRRSKTRPIMRVNINSGFLKIELGKGLD